MKNVIAGISHDFRTPLTAVKGYLQLMKKGGRIDDRDMEYLDIAIAKTEYLRVLSDAFFEVSYAEAKDEAIDIRNIDVARTLTASMSFVNVMDTPSASCCKQTLILVSAYFLALEKKFVNIRFSTFSLL